MGVIMAVGLASPAAGVPEDSQDTRGDVLSAAKYTDDLPKRPAPDRRVGDIMRTRVTLTDDLVAMTRFRSLRALGQQEFTWFLLTSEDPGLSWNAYLTVPAGRDKGHFELIDPVANQPHCGSATLDRPGRTVTLTVPASCLGDPAWVRVANGLTVVTEDRVYVDDARREGDVRHSWKYGPKVTTG
jgi:hypothetical protein